MLIVSVALTAVSIAAVIVGFTAAVLEILLANYTYSMCASGVVLMASPLTLIGLNLIDLFTPLAYH